MIRASLYRYRIPLAPPLQLPDGPLPVRSGLLLRLVSANGQEGWGEAAPLPGFSRETLAESAADLIRLCGATLHKGALHEGAPPDALSQACPSAAFALDCARLELTEGPLIAAPAAPYSATPAYPLLSGPPAAVLARWQAEALPRPAVAKLKVARATPAEDAALVGELLAMQPGLRLRLDANRGWTPDQLRCFLEALPPPAQGAIDYLEEPCQRLSDSLALAEAFRLPLALDESLRQPDFVLPASPALKALVLKPSLSGALQPLRSLISQAHARGLRTLISSSYESSLGCGQLAALASMLTPGEPPGLDTLAPFTQDLLRPAGGSGKPVITLKELECLWSN